MARRNLLIPLLLLIFIFSGCRNGSNLTVSFESPSTGSSASTDAPQQSSAPESPDITATQTDSGPFTHEIAQSGASATVALGMTYAEVTSLLNQAGIPYTAGNHWADVQPGEEDPGISLTESSACEYLNFAENGGDSAALTYIQWTLAEGDETAFPLLVATAIEAYGSLPLYYHAGSGNDAFVFPLDGGYAAQFHDYGADDPGDGQVTAMLTYDDPYSGSEPSLDYAYLLSKDPAYATSGSGAEVEAALASLRAEYGETDADGYEYSYTCEGVALYNRQLYYSISQRHLVEDEEGGGHSSYDMQFYVPVGGGGMLKGYHNEITG